MASLEAESVMREAWFAAVLVLTTLSACRPGDSGIPPISFPPPITGIVPPTDASAAPANARPSLPEIEVDLSELDRELDQGARRPGCD